MPQPSTHIVATPSLLKTPIRQSIFYVLMFAGTGSSLPFMPVWLAAHGMTAGQIGLILAAPLLLRAVSGPLSGVWADRFRLYRTPLIWLGLMAAVFYGLLAISGHLPAGAGMVRFWAYLVLFTVAFTCATSESPLIDAMTIQLARVEGFNYALPRAWGSAAFIAASVAIGYLLQIATSDIIVIWLMGFGALVAMGGRFALAPRPRQEHLNVVVPGWQRIRHLMHNEGLVWLLVAVGCLQAAHSFYYAFSTLIWKARGLSPSLCGYLWATGVVAEIAFMSLGGGLRRRLGPWRLLLLGGAVNALRWAAMAFTPPLWLLWPLQMLHAFTFAAVYLAGLELVHRLSPKGYEGLAQTINSAYVNGVLMGIVTLMSGAVYGSIGPAGYGVMTAVALVGLAAATWLYSQRQRLLAAVN